MASTKAKKQEWRAQFAAKFPQFAKILDGGAGEQEARQTFGDDLIELIIDVAKNPDNYDLTTQAGINALDAKIYATKYWNETTAAAKAFDSLTEGERLDQISTNRINIANAYGDLGLTTTELDEISKTATRRKLTGIALSQYINSKVGARARGRQDLMETLDAQALRKVAKQYNYNPSDLEDQILAAIQGKEYNGEIITSDTFKKKGMQVAKAAYFNLAPQIDAGLTLDDIFSPYRQVASRVLEMPENAIDYSDPKFSVVFGSPSTPQPSLTQWETILKTDDKYKYKFTKQANDDAKRMAMTIARAFGKLG